MQSPNSGRVTNLEFKILLVGEEGVGKTSLIRRFIENRFDENSIPNLASSESGYTTTQLNLFGAPIKLQIQDVEQVIWEDVVSYYLVDNDGILIIFDASAKMKIRPYIDYWFQPIRQINSDIPVVVIGNKSDLTVKVNIKKIAQYCSKLGINFIQTSAKTGDNVGYAFKLLTSEIVKAKAAAKKAAEGKRADGLSNIFTRYDL